MQCIVRAARVAFGDRGPRESRESFGTPMPEPRSAMEQLVPELKPSEEVVAKPFGDCAQGVQPGAQRECRRANDVPIRRRQGVGVNRVPPDALGIGLVPQPPSDFRDPPRANPAARIGALRLSKRAVRPLPLALGDKLLSFGKTDQSQEPAGSRARGECSYKRTATRRD